MTLSDQKINRIKSQGRLTDPEANPCLQEHHLSNKCLADNNYNKDKCEVYFENYRNCKQFWLEVQRERKMKGITPELPSLKEREKIKEEKRQKVLLSKNKD